MADYSPTSEQGVDLLLKVAPHLEILEHVSGRIKFRLPLSNLPKLIGILQGVDIEKEVKRIPGYKSHQKSLVRRTATIDYDPLILPYDLWTDYCKISENPEIEKSVRERLLVIFGGDGGGD